MAGTTRTLAAILAAAFLAVAARALAVRSLRIVTVEGPSMTPTLAAGSQVVVLRRDGPLRRWAGPRVGAVVVVEPPWHGRPVVKRAVAGPGAAWRDGDDRVDAGPGWVVVGDNRTQSTDSRHHGRVDAHAVLGRMIGRGRHTLG